LQSGEPESLRLTLVAPPFAGHLYPQIALARRLAARGHRVRFVTGRRKVALLAGLGFAVDTVSNQDPEAMEQIADTPHPVRGNPLRLGRQLRANLDLLPEIRRELEAVFAEHPPDLVIADFCAPPAGLVCAAAGIPWITTIPTPFALETRTGTPAYLGGWGPPRHLGHRLRDAVGRVATRATKRAFEVAFAGRFRRLGTTVYRADGSEAAYSPAAILGLGMAELEFARDWPAAFQMIGPITESPEPELPPLDLVRDLALDLPDADPSRLILVTLGTHLAWAKSGLDERIGRIARAFPRHRFVVSLGAPGEASPEPVRRGAGWAVYPYVPYDRYLDRFAAVIHHGGAGITYSCIRAARRSLVWPCDYDQFDFAARIAARQAGLAVRDLGAPASLQALDRLLHGFDDRPLAVLSAALSRYDPYAACAAVIDQLASRDRLGPGAGAAPPTPPQTPGAPGGA
jgi:UDP:flavonoid glycosyltransferase YjiC (YdhE family)